VVAARLPQAFRKVRSRHTPDLRDFADQVPKIPQRVLHAR
jgi:hypothetical protein